MSERFKTTLKLSLLGVSIGTSLTPVAARASTDDDELALIKAQIRDLENRVVKIEQRRQARSVGKQGGSRTSHPIRQGSATRGANQTASARAAGSTSASHALKAPQADTAGIRSGAPDTRLAQATLPSGRAAVTEPTSTPGSASGSAGSAIDLSSSSPLAITQTSVDHLPPVFSIGNISVRLGGFIDMSNIWRDSTITSGPATAWNNFPYANSPNHGLSEERLSAQLTRLSTLLEANPTSDIRLQAYIESDLGGAAGTTNSVQISGYTPRLRQGYFTFTKKDWGFHVLMGQAWSLSTNYAKGVTPRSEQLPAVTDNNQIPGITFLRVPQIRIGKDWGNKYWLAVSVEDPQATIAYSADLASGGRLPALRGYTQGPRVFYQNTGGLLLNPSAEYTDNPIPDVIVKGAVDTNLGHYEVFGLGRWFRSVIQSPGDARSHKDTKFGGGVGAGMTTSLFTPDLQLTGNVIAGQGIGRYGASQLPDVTFNGQGGLSPIPQIRGALGLIGHPDPSVLVYLYGGVEASSKRSYIAADGMQYGYGVNDHNLAGCSIEFGTCTAQTRTLASMTAGGWWHFLDGTYGSLMGGVQYTYIRKFAFRGSDGKGGSVYPTTFGNTVYVTFRYLPFQ
ncbi:hypothetical protein [Asaia bogorensis]|uniref:Porin n=1 Tax=Asaia bogorensis NBRC 16594 TaxID=1231624 RepID=A0AAN4R3E7_9PROT|nr:hypothetical protein Asbog_02380 [Asaia bogorensis NBRC 16594]GBQ76430.1 hypothetical protein AA0311_1155 [Asaia bogorensis NBRC 16594]GEL53645.1 hypothetical protein ABO01nite_16520 [Asaia bogorensis NBRC 16594]